MGDLLRYHNLGRPRGPSARAELLIGMCMDHRTMLRLPDRFAFVLRSAGANLRWSEFMVSYAVAVGGVRAICLVGHDDCGMVNVAVRRDLFVSGLVCNAGWCAQAATEHFDELASLHEIGDAVEFVRAEAHRLREPAATISPSVSTAIHASSTAAASALRCRMTAMMAGGGRSHRKRGCNSGRVWSEPSAPSTPRR